VYTKLGSSGSNYTRVNFDCATNQAQHRMPSVRIHGTLCARNTNIMKQHTTPVIIRNDKAEILKKVSLDSNFYNENWIQKICFETPSLLPIEEIEPSFNGMIPVCRELSTASGFVDLIYINEYGFITIGECKLWRNPEARRKVIGQILDYAKDLSKWDYDKFESECLKARKGNEKKLFDIVQEYYPEIEEHIFIDNVQSNLKKGRFLLSVIGDGIRENMEELANYIHRNGNLNFTLCLIEIPVFETSAGEYIVTPRILAKTKEIERVIYRIEEQNSNTDISPKEVVEISKSVSEKVFFERLENSIGLERAKEFQSFITDLSTDLNITTKLGRGKQLSLNLKSSNDNYNFASVQENGEVWFYGIVTKTAEIGAKQIGIDYLTKLSLPLSGELDTKNKEWSWGVKKNGKYINLIEFLKIKTVWKSLISDALESINTVEDN